MKAIQFNAFGGTDVLISIDLSMPLPLEDQVLIEVKAAGVNFVDVRQRKGIYQLPETHVGYLTLPHVPGFQVVGVVKAVGPEGDQSLQGKRVVAMLPDGGGYAQYALAPSNMTIPLPHTIDDAQAAALPMQGMTAYLALQASTQLQPGESVLIHAAGGGVGSLAIQIAKILGASRIIATASTEEKRQFAKSLGADFATDYNQPQWTRDVLEFTKDRGVDVILESIGGEVFQQNFACLAPFGRHVIFGSTTGPGKPLEPRQLMQKSQALIGLYVPVFFARPDLIRQGLQFLVDHAAEGRISAQVATVLPQRRC
ncbi:MAG TPA: zinc-binding dehydrogenase, partial [Ktedonobacteraceae bacterium]